MTLPYDITPYLVPNPRGYDPEDVYCRVTWTPRGGEPVMTEGGHLDPEESPTLRCGLEEIVTNLGLWDIVPADYSYITRAVNHQLRYRPWAELVCPQGTARLELVRVTDANTPSA